MTLNKLKAALGLSLLALLLPATAMAQQILTIESTITGSQEQPRVISIVPWHTVNEPEYIGEDLNVELVVDVFKPLDRDAFNRELNYISATRR